MSRLEDTESRCVLVPEGYLSIVQVAEQSAVALANREVQRSTKKNSECGTL